MTLRAKSRELKANLCCSLPKDYMHTSEERLWSVDMNLNACLLLFESLLPFEFFILQNHTQNAYRKDEERLCTLKSSINMTQSALKRTYMSNLIEDAHAAVMAVDDCRNLNCPPVSAHA
ncbi:hypothetical protein GOP47_0022254 [Adiantum capillus-veneris]|uniref:Uncharacterized protein n=1 Tax=Adiantum capillus-veneris TaxID=13818 RepID=A0A9D4U9E1_ADICA|nr:hypothetical protein GOP47_0022254 [Adiantum capillus-veneris]